MATYLVPEEQFPMIYWHIGKSKKANATVASTVWREKQGKYNFTTD